MEATWLAPEPNQEMSARELLRVKVVWQACAKPRGAQVWSVFEFACWLEGLRGQDVARVVDDTPRRSFPSSKLQGSKGGNGSARSLTPGPASPCPARSVTPAFARPYSFNQAAPRSPEQQSIQTAPRSPSPTHVPRPCPSPAPMPRGLDSTRSLPEALYDPLLQRATPSSCSSPAPLPGTGRGSGPQAVQTTPVQERRQSTPTQERRPQSAEPGALRDRLMALRERADTHPVHTTPLQERRPQSAEPGRESRMAMRERAERAGRRSPTPSGQPGSRRRSSSAAMVSSRPKLGMAAGPGDPSVVAKAFDKNSMRLRNGRIFVDALATWRTANGHKPSAPTRRLQPGMCAVFVRKRPVFERDRRRCDYDVLTVIRGEHESDDTSVGPEIVHHACMFDRSMVTPFVHHTQFPFDMVFDENATNEAVYRDVGHPLLENVIGGHVATLFVFGQTGSGKTYTMRAIEHMAVQELFSRLGEGTEVSLTYFELAGRKALDLLTDQKSEIRLREEEDGCFRPHDCEEAVVTSADALLQVMAEAAARRATEATTVNDTSSRSHSVCRITILRKGQAAGRLLLVDCAGTEGSKDTLYFKGQHIKQSAEINSSLFALKDCIRFRQAAINRQRGLAQEGIPLRLPSVRATPLTKVLAESLISASAQLAAIATVSPNATDAEHTIDTLRTVYTLSGRAEARVVEVRQVLE